jgi:plasmid stabilization system protein ParE
MARQARERNADTSAKTLARVVYSSRAIEHLERAFGFLAAEDPQAAPAAATAIRGAVEMLEQHPLIGRRIQGELRELVISFGRSGYVALYRFLPIRDEVRVLAIRHQRELDYPA